MLWGLRQRLAELKERIGATEIAKKLGIGRRSVYRILEGQNRPKCFNRALKPILTFETLKCPSGGEAEKQKSYRWPQQHDWRRQKVASRRFASRKIYCGEGFARRECISQRAYGGEADHGMPARAFSLKPESRG